MAESILIHTARDIRSRFTTGKITFTTDPWHDIALIYSAAILQISNTPPGCDKKYNFHVSSIKNSCKRNAFSIDPGMNRELGYFCPNPQKVQQKRLICLFYK